MTEVGFCWGVCTRENRYAPINAGGHYLLIKNRRYAETRSSRQCYFQVCGRTDRTCPYIKLRKPQTQVQRKLQGQ